MHTGLIALQIALLNPFGIQEGRQCDFEKILWSNMLSTHAMSFTAAMIEAKYWGRTLPEYLLQGMMPETTL